MTPATRPVFVDRHTAAAWCSVSVETWDAWVKSGFVPRPAIERNQTIRWHWPTVEARLAGATQEAHVDPYDVGSNANAKGRHRATA